jgi:proline iminopeptidase
MRTVLKYLWSDWRIRLAVVVGVATGAGLISAWLTPRGPITTPQALTSMAAALVLGVAGGLIMGSRWSMLVTSAVFVGVFELARLGVHGPTVDRIHLGSTYGVIAFVLGRGLHGLLVLLPMILGARFGVELAARLGRGSTARLRLVGGGFTGLLTVALVALAVAIALPATTAPIVGDDGQPLPGSVAELTTIPIGGHDQAMLIRGRSIDNPVLLYLAGGPGGTDLGAMRADVGLEQAFVVASWDQRGTGKSYAALDPAATLTLDQMVADTVEVTNYLRERFGQDKIYLVGNSWGTILGVLAVQQHPELYHAYVGTGQMVSTSETDRMFWEDSIAWANKTGNAKLAAGLRANGPPPYDDLLNYEPAIAPEHDWNPYPELDTRKEMPFNLMVPENSLMDKANGLRGFLDTFSVLYPQLRGVDLRQGAGRLDVPVYMVLGRHEARGRALPANEWFDMLKAPSKQLIIFEHSGHRPLFEEPAAFVSIMTGILADTDVND